MKRKLKIAIIIALMFVALISSLLPIDPFEVFGRFRLQAALVFQGLLTAYLYDEVRK